MAFQCGSELELSSTATLKQSRTPGCLRNTFATTASTTTRTLRYPSSTRWDAKFIASSFTGILPTAGPKNNVTTIASPGAAPDNSQIDTLTVHSIVSSGAGK